MPRTLAIIPARAGSKRIPNKNLRMLLGRPLVMWTVEFAKSCRAFDHVLMSTDSPEVADLAREAGIHVPWMRPATLASDTASSVDVVLHAVDALVREGHCFDRVALLQPTSPVRRPERWTEAADDLDRGAPAAVGVCPASSHPYWTYFLGDGGALSPCFPEGLAMRSQDLPLACVPNGALYLCGVQALREGRSLTPRGTCGVVCSDPVESIDIDTEDDWREAERLLAGSRS
jgi:CMP-N,N'-diacetyllegionaminic acid synthase